MKRIIGILMIISLFVGLFVFIANKHSTVVAFQTSGITATIMVFIAVAVSLITSKT